MRRRNPPTHDAAAQVRFSSTGLTRTTSWSEKIMSVVGLLVIKPMSQMGHFRTRVWVVAMSALPRVTDIVQRERNVRKVPITDSRLQRGRLRLGSFGHPKGENDQRHARGSAQREKGCAVSKMIDDHASS